MTRAALVGVLALVLMPGLAQASTGRVLVSLDKPADARAVAAAAQATTQRRVPEIGLVTLEPKAGQTVAELVRSLRGDEGVRAVQPEGRMQLRAVPNDPGANVTDPQAPGTRLQWPLERSNFFAAWDATRGDTAKVAVIDTGVDANHPDLQGKLDALVDQDAGSDNAGSDEVGHGTHVASLACAATDNGFGLAGAGANCRLIVEKSDLSDASIAASIVDAANRGADAINMSFGDDGSRGTVRAIADAIDYAYGKGVVLVAAAADEDVEEQGQPANLLQPAGGGTDVNAGKGLSVTAATIADRRASFAGKGSQISLAAYGSYGDTGPAGVVGAFPANQTELERPRLLPLPPQTGCDCRVSVNGDQRFAYLEGTSMAAPQVAAAAALVRRLNPDLSIGDVLRIVKETAKRPAGSGWSPDTGWGILDAGAAVAAAQRVDRRAPASRARAGKRTRNRTLTVSVTGGDAAPPGLIASGVAEYELFAARGSAAPQPVAHTTGGKVKLRVRPGATYRFYAVAVDAAGNREAPPPRPDARTKVLRRRS